MMAKRIWKKVKAYLRALTCPQTSKIANMYHIVTNRFLPRVAFCPLQHKYEGWNFNFGNAAVTFDTAHLRSSYFHRPSMYSPKLRRTRSQR